MTICNLNNVEASFLKSLGVYDSRYQTDLLINEYVIGRDYKLSTDQDEILQELKENLNGSFKDESFQRCNNLLLSITYQKKTLTWRDFLISKDGYSPFSFNTDYGICCRFTPQVLETTYYLNKYPYVDYTASQGESNGLELILDIGNEHSIKNSYTIHQSHA